MNTYSNNKLGDTFSNTQGKHAQNDKIPNLPNFVVIISSLEKSDKNEQQIGIT
jgi:hypothetical protein